MSLPKSLDSLDFSGLKIAKPQKSPQFTIIYGAGGLGKTTAACYSPDPVIVPIGRETGHEQMRNNLIPCIENPGMSPVHHVFACIAMLLKTEHTRKTLILDNIGTYRECVDEDVEADNAGTDISAFGKRQALAYPYYTRLLAGIDALLHKKNMHVILIGHDVTFNVNLPDGTYFSRTGIYAQAGENTNVRALLEARAHNVLYIKGEIPTLKTKDKFGQSKKIATSGEIKRTIYTKPSGSFFAKSRTNVQDFYEIDNSDNEKSLFHEKTNESLIKLFEDLYK